MKTKLTETMLYASFRNLFKEDLKSEQLKIVKRNKNFDE